MFLSLISGSSGNATLLKDNDTLILIDCGMSGKKLENALSKLDLSCSDINAVLLTHEHIDHVRGVGVISRRYNLPVYGTRGTCLTADMGSIDENNINIIKSGEAFEIGSIGINPFSISHDAADPVGYSFFVKNRKLSLATDSGEITPEIEKNILGSDEIILESNHDPDLLMYGTYPMNLKRRIMGNKGHLSNITAAETAVKLLKSGTKKIMLGHLSIENNTPEIAYHTTKNLLTQNGAVIEKDVFLSVASRYDITRFE